MNLAFDSAHSAVHQTDDVNTVEGDVRLINGRLVTLTLDDPVVKLELKQRKDAIRQNVDALRAYYVKAGVLTRGGKLTKRYGG